ncbi:hypothetical protein MKP08_05435 [Erythrobacter sp. LQ02-29]|uniref:hypothetical protein n=1 Tax=Erythrobacter sp. LQ02-29 TaxID=2920384 RepID=UPI001F4D7B63|nr:hypothetical protein [Erythrobacter sp. LQ02-29]MCP9222187.1 hypothetical protein [Erythrobacter sp. LQ02-29]
MRFNLPVRAAIGSLAIGLALSACEPAPPAENPEPSSEATATGVVAEDQVSPSSALPTPTPTDSAPATPANTPPAPMPTATTANGDPAVDDPHELMPAPLTADAQKGEKGARNVLLGFLRAIEMKDFRVAYALTEPGYRQQHSEAEFRALFDGMGRISVEAPTGRMEGAAGSSYYSVPATVSGSTGRKINGTIALRRVNDVPGATPYQLNWHVAQVDLKPVG